MQFWETWHIYFYSFTLKNTTNLRKTRYFFKFHLGTLNIANQFKLKNPITNPMKIRKFKKSRLKKTRLIKTYEKNQWH